MIVYLLNYDKMEAQWLTKQSVHLGRDSHPVHDYDSRINELLIVYSLRRVFT